VDPAHSDRTLADEIAKVIDRNGIVILRTSPLGTYLAVAVAPGNPAHDIMNDALDIVLGVAGDDATEAWRGHTDGDNMPGVVDTDDFTPGKALYRLAEKATTGRIV
jgi:hypothetical protein